MADKKKFEGQDRRERYRVMNETKVLVKVGNLFSQVGTIRNMTRTGIFFEAFGEYQPGLTMEVTFPYDPNKPGAGARPQHAEVVRVADIEGSMKKGVAIKLLGLFLKP